MEIPEFHLRLFAKDAEPIPPKRSINHYGGYSKLMTALANALRDDEWDELCNSKLGVFAKFYELEFIWQSRLVFHLYTLQLEYKKKYEMWCLIGAQPIRFSLNEIQKLTNLECEYVKNIDEPPEIEETDERIVFMGFLGVPWRVGPSSDDLVAACELCETWSLENRLKLAYLCIYASFIEARRPSTNTSWHLSSMVMNLGEFENYPWGRVCFKNLMTAIKLDSLFNANTIEGFVQILQIWLYEVLPNFGDKCGAPIQGDPSPPMLRYKEAKHVKYTKENILRQVLVKNFNMLAYDAMFPVWDDDIKDVKVDNIINLMCKKLPNISSWVWRRTHWKNQGKDEHMKEKKRHVALILADMFFGTCKRTYIFGIG